jgi:hypothetical protein
VQVLWQRHSTAKPRRVGPSAQPAAPRCEQLPATWGEATVTPHGVRLAVRELPQPGLRWGVWCGAELQAPGTCTQTPKQQGRQRPGERSLRPSITPATTGPKISACSPARSRAQAALGARALARCCAAVQPPRRFRILQLFHISAAALTHVRIASGTAGCMHAGLDAPHPLCS